MPFRKLIDLIKKVTELANTLKPIFITLILFIMMIPISVRTYAFTSSVYPISFQPHFQDWETVNQLIPRQSIFPVIDVDSGKSFLVQRRAGSGHADVQPLTKQDTDIMKNIYQGKWSWHRRAIFIVANDQLIPASMHGMPHGAGALANGFSGHFCIHFPGSTTHGSGKPDPSHHVMILKAAGKFDEYVNHLSPHELLDAFFVIVKNNDNELLKKVVLTEYDANKQLQALDKIEAIRWTIDDNAQEINEFTRKLDVEVKMYVKELGPSKTTLSFFLIRTSPISEWKVVIDPLSDFLREVDS